jgi:hypothetical protein
MVYYLYVQLPSVTERKKQLSSNACNREKAVCRHAYHTQNYVCFIAITKES